MAWLRWKRWTQTGEINKRYFPVQRYAWNTVKSGRWPRAIKNFEALYRGYLLGQAIYKNNFWGFFGPDGSLHFQFSEFSWSYMPRARSIFCHGLQGIFIGGLSTGLCGSMCTQLCSFRNSSVVQSIEGWELAKPKTAAHQPNRIQTNLVTPRWTSTKPAGLIQSCTHLKFSITHFTDDLLTCPWGSDS